MKHHHHINADPVEFRSIEIGLQPFIIQRYEDFPKNEPCVGQRLCIREITVGELTGFRISVVITSLVGIDSKSFVAGFRINWGRHCGDL